ncbi:hypothetical protein D3C74_335640 [compost metagenome]
MEREPTDLTDGSAFFQITSMAANHLGGIEHGYPMFLLLWLDCLRRAEQAVDGDIQVHFFLDFTDDGCLQGLIGIYFPARNTPGVLFRLAVPPGEKHFAPIIQDDRAYANAR